MIGGNIFEQIFQDDGTMRGCAVKYLDNLITVGEGYFYLKGRVFRITQEEKIAVDAVLTNGFLRLIYRVDLSKFPSSERFAQESGKSSIQRI